MVNMEEAVEKREVEENVRERGEMENMRKRRGRPRKYSIALAPLPISSSYSYVPVESGLMAAWKGGRVHPFEVVKKQATYGYESTGEGIAYSIGANFTPHIINVNTGEDVTMKILSFSQQGTSAICILSTTGSISNVTLRQPNSSGGTITYEGRFELLSLTGSFVPTNKYGAKSRSGGMSVSLAGPDGRVIGGGLAGMLIAASPVQVMPLSFLPLFHTPQGMDSVTYKSRMQVVVGSFLPGHQQEQHKQKKQQQQQQQQQNTLQSVMDSEMKDEVVALPNSENPVVGGGGIEEQRMVMAQQVGERRGNGGNSPLMNCLSQ